MAYRRFRGFGMSPWGRCQATSALHNGSGQATPQLFVILIGVLIAAVLCGAFPVAAGAAPVSYFPLPGGKENTIDDLTVANDGTLWVAQSLSTGPYNSERHMRILHVSQSGTLLSTTPSQEGEPIFSEMVPASDGGVWVNAFPGLEHIASDGSVDDIADPAGGGMNLVAGRDGRAWLQHCTFTYPSTGTEEHCEAAAVSIGGEVQTYDLSGFGQTWPAGATSAGGIYTSVATETGVWFWKLVSFGGAPPTGTAEFVSYQGTGTPVGAIPPQGFLMAPAAGDSVWWLNNEGLGGATIGQINVAGHLSDTQRMGNLSEYLEHPDSFTADPGREDDLIWAQNATWNDEFDGQIGVAGLNGSNTGFLVEHDATAVPTSTPDFWSGSCTFGVRLYQATDGALWTISGGHPDRLTRQQLNGQFSTFLLNGASEFTGEEETGVWGMVESGPDELWFTLNTPHGPELARLDPLDPPPAEPRMPKYGSETTERRPIHKHRQRNRAVLKLLNSLISQTRLQLHHHTGSRGHLELNASFPTAGTVAITLARRRKRHRQILIGGKRHGASGNQTLLVAFRPALRHLLRGHDVTKASIVASFRPAGSKRVAKRSSMLLHR